MSFVSRFRRERELLYFVFLVNGSLAMSIGLDSVVPSLTIQRPYNIIQIVPVVLSPLKVRVTLQIYQTDEQITVEGMVCDDLIDHNSLRHVCQSMGKSYVSHASVNGPQENTCQIEYTSQRSSIPCLFILDDLRCGNNTNNLSQCTHLGLFKHNCGTSEHLSVVCR